MRGTSGMLSMETQGDRIGVCVGAQCRCSWREVDFEECGNPREVAFPGEGSSSWSMGWVFLGVALLGTPFHEHGYVEMNQGLGYTS